MVTSKNLCKDSVSQDWGPSTIFVPEFFFFDLFKAVFSYIFLDNAMTSRTRSVRTFSSHFNEMSVRQVLRIRKIISFSLRCDLYLTPNSHDYAAKKSMVLVRIINVSIVGMKGFKMAEHCWATLKRTSKRST